MCKPEKSKKEAKKKNPIPSVEAPETSTNKKAPKEKEHSQEETVMTIRRRGKRTKQKDLPLKQNVSKISRVSSSLSKRHAGDAKSGGIEAILPSFAIVVVLACAYLAKSGFRGRSSVAGIDLGTTNSVICVQQQAEGVGEIECIPDPYNNSPIIPSVISFMDPHHHYVKLDKEDKSGLFPHPTYVKVGAEAKLRIDTHPHHTLYHAKRVLGKSFDDTEVKELQKEVEFQIGTNDTDVAFRVPFHLDLKDGTSTESISLSPHRVGSYVVNHMIQITKQYLGHDNVKSAVIAVPAKFDQHQKESTVKAFQDAGIKVARILEEPVAAALAYGLQKKENVDYILVYDFGGGTLDVSMLQVFDGGYVEVMGNDGDNHLGGADFDAAVAHSLLEVNDGVGGKIVERVTNALTKIQSRMEENSEMGEEDMEELLSSQCDRLNSIPLCTLSSFHTLGEKIKIELSSQTSDKEDAICLGISEENEKQIKNIADFCDALEPMKLTITLEEYDAACSSLFARALNPIGRLLKDLDLEVDEIDEVVMVGGTTRMPQIRELVRKELGVESLNTSIDPDLTVAYGAASVID
ncbi:hypothetical protein CTEN210_02994 [Chaetoceros tenuissimus]|uniref:Uncharacterized protein n=1 Tax=Chaetoceros tenuissimus TaxID=426638 RepID=A0AAD3H145_9STRA|nr:hypothetical protein CTEN210_02994 [Chaetoceros tenuissimus]